jgi:hypothetical protein
MGILTRRQDDAFVITSDRPVGAAATNRAPTRLTDDYQVWNGTAWSATKSDALSFASLDAADEFVRANIAKMTG